MVPLKRNAYQKFGIVPVGRPTGCLDQSFLILLSLACLDLKQTDCKLQRFSGFNRQLRTGMQTEIDAPSSSSSANFSSIRTYSEGSGG